MAYMPLRLLRHMFLTISVISSAYILSEIISVQHSVTHSAHGVYHVREISWVSNQSSTNSTVPISILDKKLSIETLLTNGTTRISMPSSVLPNKLIPTQLHTSIPISTPNSSIIEHRRQVSDCVGTSNIAFIKTHKTGSSTFRSIINRYGLGRNASFVYLKESKNGHIRYSRLTDSLRKKFLPPIGVSGGNGDVNRGYNMSTVHIRFSRKFFDTFMAPGTKYVTILRDPVDQWLSVVSYFNMKRYASADVKKKSFEEIATTLALNADSIRSQMRESSYYFFQNNQAFDLGLSVKNCRDDKAIEQYVEYLGKQFEMVLINEYFDESLVLLKKTLCWSWSDILYISRNVQASKHGVRNETVKAIIRRNNNADQYMYDYFNRTLWRKIDEYGEQFQKDLAYFKELLTQVRNACNVEVVKKRGRLYYQLGKDRSSLCQELQANDQISTIRRRQTIPKQDAKPKPSIDNASIDKKRNKSITAEKANKSSVASEKNSNTSYANSELTKRKTEVVKKSEVREPTAVRDARIACEKDPVCKKIEYSRRPDGQIRIVRYFSKKNS